MKPRARRSDRGPSLFGEEPRFSKQFEARIVAGLDEAGLGPMLGPLSIGMSAFRVHDGRQCLWKALGDVVTDEIERDGERLVVADSKLVFTRNARGAERLERTVLAFEALSRCEKRACASTRAFLEGTSERLRATGLALEPWYGHLAERLAPECAGDALAETIARLEAALVAARVEIAALAVRAVPPSELNASFAVTESKGATHWRACVPFLAHLWERFGVEGIELVVDRHGGRMRYAPLLQETYRRAKIEVVREEPAISEYLLMDDERRAMRVVFAEKAESLSFAVALASCCAKYAREVCMGAFNAYFETMQPGLAPTAGYVTDARRWLVDAQAAIERSGIGSAALIRTR